MTEPQTITTALISQSVINRIFRDQHKLRNRIPIPFVQQYNSDGTTKLHGIADTEQYQVIYNSIYIIAPFEITGFYSLHKHIIETGTTSPEVMDTLKRIYEAAKENIRLFESLPTSTDEHRDIICYKVDEQGNISTLHKRSGNYEGQRFTNSDLYEYCDKVEDFVSGLIGITNFALEGREFLRILQLPAKDAPPAKDQEPTYNTLLEAFKDVSEYKRVMAILQSKGYIAANYIWQDQKKGWMSLVVSIIKLFAVKGYCKKTKFNPAEIQAICINTFQIEKISISTIKHADFKDITINFD
jgi:hypothetical protein